MVSPNECAASDSIAEEPEASPATSLAAAINRLAAPATRTVEVDSSSAMPPAYPSALRLTRRGQRVRRSRRRASAVTRPPRTALAGRWLRKASRRLSRNHPTADGSRRVVSRRSQSDLLNHRKKSGHRVPCRAKRPPQPPEDRRSPGLVTGAVRPPRPAGSAEQQGDPEDREPD